MTKTIDIDKDAYDCLEQARQSGESLSAVIKRHVRPRMAVEDVLRVLRKSSLSDETLEAVDHSVSQRRRAPRRRRT